MGNSELNVGDTIECKFYLQHRLKKEKKKINTQSGKYLITKCRHVITKQIYDTRLRVCQRYRYRIMILTKSEYETLNSFQELEEKLILFNGGKNYGQIVFMAGGAGSGKGFAIQNFMQGEKFKVRDVDEWKKALIKLAKMKDKDSELAKLNLRNPEDVFKLHTIVREKGIKNKTLDMLLTGAKKDRLPNILFDITMKDSNDITDVAPRLIEAGYEPKNIHLVWVLTSYKQAAKANKERDRVVPDAILFSHIKSSHEYVTEN